VQEKFFQPLFQDPTSLPSDASVDVCAKPSPKKPTVSTRSKGCVCFESHSGLSKIPPPLLPSCSTNIYSSSTMAGHYCGHRGPPEEVPMRFLPSRSSPWGRGGGHTCKPHSGRYCQMWRTEKGAMIDSEPLDQTSLEWSLKKPCSGTRACVPGRGTSKVKDLAMGKAKLQV
jgi:hypothetical protein